ncbi:MAG: UDP-3-O-acyl-N-acetylglucosamine deacetylase [Pseudomonadota bacterium]
MQTTLKQSVSFAGKGLHLGKPATVRVLPASAEHGIWFRRTDVTDRDAMIPASWDAVVQTPLCTRIGNSDGVSLSTIEHLMAALAGCGIQNALIEVDGPEVPILDGSSREFVSRFLSVGTRELTAPIYAIEILRPVLITKGEARARFEQSETLEFDVKIDFADAAIGRQSKRLNMANGTFVHELADCRTFCRKSDVDEMRAQGLALGGTLFNAVVVDGSRVLTPGGVRYRDEAVRHKMLDILGDLSLAGAPIIGRYVADRPGHALTNSLLRALFADPTAFRMIECSRARARLLPGAGLTRADAPLVA